MKIYSLETLWGHREWSLKRPIEQAWEVAGFYEHEIEMFVHNYFYGKTTIMGITREIARLMMLRWFIIAKHTQGFGSDTALTASKVNFQHFMSERAAGTAVPLLMLAAGFAVLLAVFGWFELQQGTGGSIRFKRGRVLMRYNEWLWWGNLVGRPSKYEFDFAACVAIGFTAFGHRMPDGPGFGKLDVIDFHKLWQTVSRGRLYNYVYTWTSTRARFRGVGHRIKMDTWRMLVAEGDEDFWEVPIGWHEDRVSACEFLKRFDDYFLIPDLL